MNSWRTKNKTNKLLVNKMMKIVASLVILGLCANVAFAVTGSAVAVVAQSGAFSSSVLNSSAVQVIKGTNTTDAAVYDSASATTDIAGVSAVLFGPGATNGTSYIWGLIYGSQVGTATASAGTCGAAGACTVYTTSSLRKRTINNTIAAWGNDTTQASVVGDTAVSVSVIGDDQEYAVGPGYLAILSSGIDSDASQNNQVWITIISGAAGTNTNTKLTTTADVYDNTAGTTPAVGAACTATSFNLGNVWYDKYTGAFLYTYSKKVISTAVATVAGTCGAVAGTVNTIYLGATYVNGTALLTTPISVSAATAANDVSGLIGGVDNSNYASYVWLAYKDNDATTPTTYVSKTLISANTTAVGSFSALVADSIPATPTTGTSTYTTMEYTPVAVWASNFTYAVAVANTTTQTPYTGSTAGTPVVITYGVTNYFNGTTTGVATAVSIGSTSGTLAGYEAWQLNTGYTVVSATTAATGSPATTTYSLATFFANGTANATSVTAATFSYSGPQFYEDANGTMWVGWNDVDTGNSQLVYNAYLAKFQGQLNIPTFANVISTISAFVALFLAAIFVF